MQGSHPLGDTYPFINERFALSVTPEYLVKIGLLDKAPDASRDIGRRRQQVTDVVSGASRMWCPASAVPQC